MSSSSNRDEEDEEEWLYYDTDKELSDFWQSLLSSAASCDPGSASPRDPDPTSSFLRLFEEPSPESVFLDFWRLSVPRALSPQPGRTALDQRIDEDRVNRY